MFFKFACVHCLEVARQSLRLNWMHNWCALLHNLWRVGLHKSEVLIVLIVCRFKFKVRRHVAAQFEFLRINLKHVGVLYQVFHRLVSMLLIVSRSSLERQWIDRVLRSLFVENIFLSVVPVGEAGHVRTHLNNGFGAFNDFLLIRISW